MHTLPSNSLVHRPLGSLTRPCRVSVRATQYESNVATPLPPPPPPPPPAPEQGSGSRRNILGLVAATATSALLGYMLPVQDLDTNAAKEIVLKREPRNFKRDFNGRVAVIGSDGTEYEIALDPRKRGVVLMHETNMDEFSHFNRGKTYSMQTRASQVDLQDDVVVDFFNSYSDWENRMVRVFDPEMTRYAGGDRMRLTTEQFREYVDGLYFPPGTQLD